MLRKRVVLLSLLALGLLVLASNPVWADRLADAIAKAPQGSGAGMIDPNAPKG